MGPEQISHIELSQGQCSKLAKQRPLFRRQKVVAGGPHLGTGIVKKGSLPYDRPSGTSCVDCA